jgi:hypothetical protein
MSKPAERDPILTLTVLGGYFAVMGILLYKVLFWYLGP